MTVTTRGHSTVHYKCAWTDLDPCHGRNYLLWYSNFVNSDLHRLINNSDHSPYTKLCDFARAYCDGTFRDHFYCSFPRAWGHVDGSLYPPDIGKVGESY